MIWLRIGTSGDLLHGNEPLGYIKCWEILEWLYGWQLLKNGLSMWSYNIQDYRVFGFCPSSNF
jgi:hypothetical protein